MAVIFNNEQLTYGMLNQRANQLAWHLISSGIQPEQRVVLYLKRSVDVLVGMLGVLKAGAAYVPLDPGLPDNRLSFIVNDCDAQAVITTSDLISTSVQSIPVLIALDALEDSSKLWFDDVGLPVAPEQLAYVIYTSGTTGKPKGVLIEHQSVCNYADWFAEYAHVCPQVRVDWSSHHMFDMAVTTTITPLMLGLTVVVCSPETQRCFQSYLQYVRSSRVHILKMTPTYFKELLRETSHQYVPLPDVQRIILGGEALRARDCQRWLECYPNHILINEYGPTEATVAFSHYVIDSATPLLADGHVLIGRPGLNMHGDILDERHQRVFQGDEGELYIGGAGLARGYLNLPELTCDRFIIDPFRPSERLYKTGDRCRALPDGTIEYLDRIDRQVKIRGFRVELNEIEQCLEEYAGIEDAAVVVRHNKHQDMCLIAYYTADPSMDNPTNADFRQYLLLHLPHYMVPHGFVRLSAFPMAENGKLDYGLLPDELPSIDLTFEQSLVGESTDCYSEIEKSLLSIWSFELGYASVTLDDDFWELGGHSLTAARLVSNINQWLAARGSSKRMNVRELYETNTIRQLIQRLDIDGHDDNHVEMLIKSASHKQCASPKERHQSALSDFQTLLWASKTFKPEASHLNIVARKRFQGSLDSDRLQQAFERVISKHSILSYRIGRWIPMQRYIRPKSVTIETIHLEQTPDAELVLQRSIDELMALSNWDPKVALIRVRLFYLKEQAVELQLAIPHVISDGLSLNIVFSEASFFYTTKSEHAMSVDVKTTNRPFSEYVLEEQSQLQQTGADDERFWSDYLKDAHLFSFPRSCIASATSLFSYSSYLPISNATMHHLESFCRHQKINVSDALCAVLGMSMMSCAKEPDKHAAHFMVNVVKSTRDNLAYQKTIGCFLRVDPVKLLLDSKQTLLSLSKQVHAFFLKQASFQQTSSLLKLAAFNPFYRKKKNITYFAAKGCVGLYLRILQLFKLKHDVLKQFPELSRLDTRNKFAVYLNIWNNFIQVPAEEPRLFGLNHKPIELYQCDLLAVDYVFEACFLRDESHHQPYVVISSNLEPAFRERIAHEMVRMMNEEMAMAYHRV